MMPNYSVAISISARRVYRSVTVAVCALLLLLAAPSTAANGLTTFRVDAAPSASVYNYDDLPTDHVGTTVLVAGPVDRAARSASVGAGLTYDLPSNSEATNTATGSARYVVDSDGVVRIFVNEGTLEVSSHAAKRITQRGLTVDLVDDLVSTQKPFDYFHAGVWKVGYYDEAQRVFVGSVDGTITTVIDNATPNYIRNLMAATP